MRVTPTTPRPTRLRQVRLARAAAAYVALFAVLGAPWLRAAWRSVPAGALLVAPADERLIPWILAWVTHALATDPHRLFDANINYPAPAELSGTEHLLSTQVLFAPALAASGNPVFSANLVAWASYPMAGIAMDALLRALGCGAVASWVGGLLFALGPLRVPANLQIVQYLNAYIPLVCLAIMRCVRRPTPGRVLCAVGTVTMAVFSAYYVAVMLAVVLVVWVPLELRRRPGGVGRRIVAVAIAIVVPAVQLGWFSAPYLVRLRTAGAARAFDPVAESRSNADVPGVAELVSLGQAVTTSGLGTLGRLSLFVCGFVRIVVVPAFGAVALVLAAIGAVVSLRAPPVARALARRGLLVAAVTLPLVFVPVQVASVAHPSSSLLAALLVPFRLFRMPFRMLVVTGFGTALLGAAAIDAVRSRAVALALGAASVGALVATHGVRLVGGAPHPVTAHLEPVYDVVRAVTAREGRGPLLELPVLDEPILTRQRDVMLGSTRHWLPLITGATGYAPVHSLPLYGALQQLPSGAALDTLVDLTHVRWLLLHPRTEWAVPTTRDRLLALSDVRAARVYEDWVLARIDRVPQHPEWFASVAAGRWPPPAPGVER